MIELPETVRSCHGAEPRCCTAETTSHQPEEAGPLEDGVICVGLWSCRGGSALCVLMMCSASLPLLFVFVCELVLICGWTRAVMTCAGESGSVSESESSELSRSGALSDRAWIGVVRTGVVLLDCARRCAGLTGASSVARMFCLLVAKTSV